MGREGKRGKERRGKEGRGKEKEGVGTDHPQLKKLVTGLIVVTKFQGELP